MNGFEVERFSFEGKNYEIRIRSDGTKVYIRVFCEGEPANGFGYEVDTMTSFSLKRRMGFDSVKYLIHAAKEDVEQKRWEKHLEAVEKVKRHKQDRDPEQPE